MRIHYLQHVPFEGLGFIETWLHQNQHTITSTQVWQEKAFPALTEFDILIILGGPMSVHDDDRYSWLPKEKKFISDAISAQKKIIGICLGAQILATLLGGNVSTNTYPEIGWFPIKINTSFAAWLGCGTAQDITVFHWHGDTFELPHGAVNHAASEACRHQLFTFEEHIIGIQFHPEVSTNALALMLENENEELTDGPFIQPAASILKKQHFIGKANELMKAVLAKFCT